MSTVARAEGASTDPGREMLLRTISVASGKFHNRDDRGKPLSVTCAFCKAACAPRTLINTAEELGTDSVIPVVSERALLFTSKTLSCRDGLLDLKNAAVFDT